MSSKVKWVESSGMVQNKSEARVGLILRWIIVAFAIAFALFPVVFIVASAFNPAGTLANSRSLIPKVDSITELFSNFRALLIDELELFPFWNWIRNSLVVATTTTVLTVFMGAMAAYSFSRFRFRGRRSLLQSILLINVFPNVLALVALYLILLNIKNVPDLVALHLPFLPALDVIIERAFNLAPNTINFFDFSWMELLGLNSLGGLILVYLGGAMGANTLLMKGYFDNIPREIDESARVDGATDWQIFWSLILPLVRPVLAVVAVLAFIGTFNEFVLAGLLIEDKQNWTLMVGLFEFVNADFNRDWGKFAAGALVCSIPVVGVYLVLQRQIVGGLASGAVKG